MKQLPFPPSRRKYEPLEMLDHRFLRWRGFQVGKDGLIAKYWETRQ